MLKYNHIFNTTNLDLPYHIHYIDSDTSSFIIRVNGISIGEFKPTVGTKYKFEKIVALPEEIWRLLIAGTNISYNKEINSIFYAESNIKYIKDGSGNYLAINPETNGYYWTTDIKTRFYFNPYYFSSSYLWTKLIGYVPTGVYLNNIWSEDEARDTFTQIEFLSTEIWQGERFFDTLPPVEISYFQEDQLGYSSFIEVGSFIYELQDLNNGDYITIDNGKETINFIVENCTTSALYEEETTTDRPIVHVPIQFINPNKEVLYAKTLESGAEETVAISLYDNDIKFTVKRLPPETT